MRSSILGVSRFFSVKVLKSGHRVNFKVESVTLEQPEKQIT